MPSSLNFVSALPMHASSLPEAVAEACGEYWKEAGVAEIVVVAEFKSGKVLLEAGVLIDGLAAYRR
jgi:hypothetical protein